MGDKLIPYPPEFAEKYRQAGVWGDQTLSQEFHRTALKYPDRTAVITPQASLTYRELDERSDLVAAGLLNRGLENGDRVLFQVTNSTETLIAWYAVLKAGLIPVCTLALHRHHEIDEIARQTEARAHLVQANLPNFDLVNFAREVAERQPTLEFLLTIGSPASSENLTRIEDLQNGDPAQARALVEKIQSGLGPEDVAAFQLSGGTTSVPKVIPRLQAEYWHNGKALAEAWNWNESTVYLHALPIVHNAGIVFGTLSIPAVGGCLVLIGPDLTQVPVSIQQNGVTDILLTPDLASNLVSRFSTVPELRQACQSLKHLVISGGKPHPSLGVLIDETGIECLQLFGMGEGMCFSTPEQAPAQMRYTTVGVPASPLDEVRILAPESEDEVPFGEVGELCCRGPYTLRGYYDATDRNKTAFTTDGFYRTGDLAQGHEIEGTRCYSIEGRIKDLINRGGEKINVEEVEQVLIQFPPIQQVALVAMPDPRLGERPCAYIMLKPEMEPFELKELQTYLENFGLAKYKWPERLEFVKEFPTTAAGKFSKKIFREDIARKLKG
jgi:2,3-dihydroxybenzoate-AMP ligase